VPDPSPEEPKKPAEKAAPKTPRRTALPVITQNRMFVLLILIVTGAFAFSLVGLALLAILAREPPTEMQKRFGEVCVYIAMVTIGALVGLLGGRAAAPDRLEIGDR
jgi:hypothetical protein